MAKRKVAEESPGDIEPGFEVVTLTAAHTHNGKEYAPGDQLKVSKAAADSMRAWGVIE